MLESSEVRSDNPYGAAGSRREPRDTAEQVTRREPQLGAEPRREDEDEKRETRTTVTIYIPG